MKPIRTKAKGKETHDTEKVKEARQLMNNTYKSKTKLINGRFYSDEDVYLEKDEVKVLPNQFIMLVSNINEKKTALARFVDYGSPLQKV